LREVTLDTKTSQVRSEVDTLRTVVRAGCIRLDHVASFSRPMVSPRHEGRPRVCVTSDPYNFDSYG